MSRQNDRILNLWFVYIMFYICFKHLFLNDTFLYIVMDLLFFIIILKEIAKREAIDDICRRFRIKIRLEWIFFFILISDMFLSTFYAADFFNAIKFFIVYLNFLVIAVWFSYLPGWEAKMYKWMKAGCLFHLVFTYFSVIFTDFSLKITGHFLPEDIQQLTVRWAKEMHCYAGMSGQTGTNAFFFAILIGLLLAEWCSSDKHKISTKILLTLAFIGLILTGKKGIFLTVIITVAVIGWMVMNQRFRKWILLITSMCGILTLIGCLFFHDLIFQLFYVSVISRINIMDKMIFAIQEKPLLGHGVNSIVNYTYNGRLGHNIYLQMWVEQGVVGLILLILALSYSVCKTLRKIQRYKVKNSVIRASCFFSLFIQLYVIIQGFFENSFYEYNTILLYFFSLAAEYTAEDMNLSK